jgi:hypothetical protein
MKSEAQDMGTRDRGTHRSKHDIKQEGQ